jgi:polyphenol oxidase
VAVLAPLAVPTAAGVVQARFTSRRDGDLSADELGPFLASGRWAGLAGVPVTWLDQRHTAAVVVVTSPAEHVGRVADAAVTATGGLGVAVWVGDCVPALLVADEGPFAVVHAGWRGLAAGVVGRAVDAVRALGGVTVRAWLGPSIRPCCYEFGEAGLEVVAHRWGPGVRSRTSWGTDALDVPAGVRAALREAGVDDVVDHGPCTGCDLDYWSYRRRGDRCRQGLVAWRAAA